MMARSEGADLPRVGVIAVTWNCEGDIPALVLSLREQVLSTCTMRVVVVDNDSSDGTLSLVAELAPEFDRVQLGRDGGYAAGANAGIAHLGDCDAYFVINPDLGFHPNAVEELWKELQTSGAGIVVPKLVDPAQGLRLSLRREPTVLRAWAESIIGGRRAGRVPILGEVVVDERAYDGARDADWATGAAMFISARCAESVGEWDESYFFYSEETDFALRARDKGFRLRYTPKAVVMHDEGESHESPPLYALLTRNRIKLYRSRHGAFRTALFRCGVLLGLILRMTKPTHRAALLSQMGRPGIDAKPVPSSAVQDA